MRNYPIKTLLYDRYEIIADIGGGGMGKVMKALDIVTGDIVAIKQSYYSNPDAPEVKRMRREATIDIRDSHVAKPLDFFEFEGDFFLVSEYIEGDCLSSILERKGTFSPDEAKMLIRQVAEGLSAAHKKNVIHRDVKPDNMMLTKDGILKVIDFGLARVVGTKSICATGALPGGTLMYCAPEQYFSAEVDARGDLYSLGVTWFEFLTGSRPFEHSEVKKLVLAVACDPPPIHIIPYEPVRNIIGKLLEKRPEDRYQTADELIHDIDHGFTAKTTVRTFGACVCGAELGDTNFCVRCGRNLSIPFKRGYLLVVSGKNNGRKSEIIPGEFIQRDKVAPHEVFMSRQHAGVTFGQGSFWIKDASMNGTCLNSHKITDATRLCNDDMLRFGDVAVQFKEELK